MARAYLSAEEYPSQVLESGYVVDSATVARIVERASLAVDSALVGVWYETDADQLPTDADILAAVKQATLYQADALLEDHLVAVGERPPRIKSAQIGSASYTLDNTAGAAGVLPANGSLCPDAVRALKVAGLLNIDPWVVG